MLLLRVFQSAEKKKIKTLGGWNNNIYLVGVYEKKIIIIKILC